MVSEARTFFRNWNFQRRYKYRSYRRTLNGSLDCKDDGLAVGFYFDWRNWVYLVAFLDSDISTSDRTSTIIKSRTGIYSKRSSRSRCKDSVDSIDPTSSDIRICDWKIFNGSGLVVLPFLDTEFPSRQTWS